MKTYNGLRPLLCCLFSCVIYSSTFAQVGINTTTPRKTLEVAGDMVISNNLDIGTFNPIQDGDTSTFLIQNTNDLIRSIDVSNPTAAALGYIQEYIITNPQGDWVLDFNTGIQANDYVLTTISANYNEELVLSSTSGAEDNASLPYTATFVQGGKWHIIADYPVVDNKDPNAIGTWTIRTLIYSKDLSKQLGEHEIPMAGATTGSAVTPIID